MPREFIDQDLTQNNALGDEERADVTETPINPAPIAPPLAQPAPAQPAAKERDEVAALWALRDEIRAAREVLANG